MKSITTGNFKRDHFGWIIAWQEGFSHWSPHHVNHWWWQLWTPQIPYISMLCREWWDSWAHRHGYDRIWSECTESLHNCPWNCLNLIINHLHWILKCMMGNSVYIWFDRCVHAQAKSFVFLLSCLNFHSCAWNYESWIIFTRNSSRADCGIFINRYRWSDLPGVAFFHYYSGNRTEISSNEEQIAQTGSNQC